MPSRLDHAPHARSGSAYPQDERLQKLIDQLGAATQESGGKKRYLYAVQQDDGSLALKASRRIGMRDAARRFALRYDAIDSILREFEHIEEARPVIGEIRALLLNHDSERARSGKTTWRALFGMGRDIVSGRLFRSAKPLHTKLTELQKVARGDGQLETFLSISPSSKLLEIASETGISTTQFVALRDYLSWKATSPKKPLDEYPLRPSAVARAFASVDQHVRNHPECMDDPNIGKLLVMLWREARQFAHDHAEWAAPQFLLSEFDWIGDAVDETLPALITAITASVPTGDFATIADAANALGKALGEEITQRYGASADFLLSTTLQCLRDDAKRVLKAKAEEAFRHRGAQGDNAGPAPEDERSRLSVALQNFDTALKDALIVSAPLPAKAGETWTLNDRTYTKSTNPQVAWAETKIGCAILVPARGVRHPVHLECEVREGIGAKRAVLLQEEINIHRHLSQKRCDAVVALEAVVPGDKATLVFEGRHYGSLSHWLTALRLVLGGDDHTADGTTPRSPRAAARPVALDEETQRGILRHIAYGAAQSLTKLHAAGVAHLHLDASAIAMLHRPPTQSDRGTSASTASLPVARLDQLHCATTQDAISILDDVFHEKAVTCKAPERLLKRPGASYSDHLPSATSLASRFDTKAADVWSFGLLLFEIFHPTGESLFKGDNAEALHKEISRYGFQRAALLRGELDRNAHLALIEKTHPGLGKLIAWILNPDPILRPTMPEVLARLEENGFGAIDASSNHPAHALNRGGHPGSGAASPLVDFPKLFKFADQCRRVHSDSSTVNGANAGRASRSRNLPRHQPETSRSDSQSERILDAPRRDATDSQASGSASPLDDVPESEERSGGNSAPHASSEVLLKKSPKRSPKNLPPPPGSKTPRARQTSSREASEDDSEERSAFLNAVTVNPRASLTGNQQPANPSSEASPPGPTVLFERVSERPIEEELDALLDEFVVAAEVTATHVSQPQERNGGITAPGDSDGLDEILELLEQAIASERNANEANAVNHSTATDERDPGDLEDSARANATNANSLRNAPASASSQPLQALDWIRAIEGELNPPEQAKLKAQFNAWQAFVQNHPNFKPDLGQSFAPLADDEERVVAFVRRFHATWQRAPQFENPAIFALHKQIAAFRATHPWILDGGLAPYHFFENMVGLCKAVWSSISEIVATEALQLPDVSSTSQDDKENLSNVLAPLADHIVDTDPLRVYVLSSRERFAEMFKGALNANLKPAVDDEYLAVQFAHYGPNGGAQESPEAKRVAERVNALVDSATDELLRQVDSALPVTHSNGQWFNKVKDTTLVPGAFGKMLPKPLTEIPQSVPGRLSDGGSSETVPRRYVGEENKVFQWAALSAESDSVSPELARYVAVAHRIAKLEKNRDQAEARMAGEFHVVRDPDGGMGAMVEVPRYGRMSALQRTSKVYRHRNGPP